MNFIKINNDRNSRITPQNIKSKKQNDTLCSSGANYIVAKEDGKLYRCFNDLKQIGSIGNFQLETKATPCKIGYICDTSSDQMFCTQWNQEKKKGYYKNNPVSTNWKDTDPNDLNTNHLYLVAYPTMRCNFRCAYCCNYYPSNENNVRPEYEDEISTNKWISFFKTLKNHYSSVQVNFNGGEPLLRKDIDILIQKTLDLGFCGSMVTNFSVYKKLEDILNIENPIIKDFQFTITLHPINNNFNFEKTLKYIERFKEREIQQRIVILGWPDNIKYYKEWKPIFEEMEIPFWLKWCGGYEYNQGHIEYLVKNGAGKSTAQYLDEIEWNKPKKTKFIKIDNTENKHKKNKTGKFLFHKKKEVSCTSGLDYCAVHFSGKIIKCYNLYGKGIKKSIIGNLDNYNEIWNYSNYICPKMECNEACEGYKVEVWDKEGTRIFNDRKILWRPLNKSIKQVNKDNFFIQADLVAGCYNKCPYCYTGFSDKKKLDLIEIDTDKLMGFLSETAKRKKGIKRLNISGSGESLLHSRFEEIINHATSLGFTVELISSCLLNEEKLFDLERQKNITLIISLHPLSPNWNDNKMKNFIKKISKMNYYAIMGSLVDHKDNMKFYKKLKSLCNKNNVHFYTFPYWEFQ